MNEKNLNKKSELDRLMGEIQGALNAIYLVSNLSPPAKDYINELLNRIDELYEQ